MISTDVLYDFPKEQGFTPVNFCVDPEDWAVVVYTGQDLSRGHPCGVLPMAKIRNCRVR